MRASFTFTSLASLALLSTRLATAHGQPAGIEETPSLAQYEALLMNKINFDEQVVGARDAEARPAGGYKLRHHGHKHAHVHNHHKPSPASSAAVAAATKVEKRAAASTSLIAAPVVSAATYLGDSTNNPSLDYFWPQIDAELPTLTAPSILTVAVTVEPALATDYPIFNGSGSLVLTSQNENQLYRLDTTPLMSRDAGKGGYLNGSKLFIFSDTETFAGVGGAFTGFTSNSVAVDWGFNAADGMRVAMRDKVGVWSNNNGAMRGWIPWTTGEKAYNNQMNSEGGRIAIWPDSSITPYSDGVAIQYAPIVLVNSTDGVEFIQLGITLYEITIPNQRSGPVANRIAPYLFPIDSPSWGVMGAVRSWGAEGVGGTDGWVYVFTNNGNNGLMVGRVAAASVADVTAYEYYWPSAGLWNSTWTTESFQSGSYSASDIFYSPMHQTFIQVYEDRYIDNKFLWRWLEVPEPLVPTYDGTDFVENIVNYPWSQEQTLYQAPTPGNGEYIYGAGPNLGYFEDDDITNGGNKMLLHWTAPTGLDANAAASGYAIPACIITWA